MRRRGQQLHWNSPMPKRPARQRHESPRTGDNRGAIYRARGAFLDLNVVYALGILWAMHYTIPWLCGYRYIDVPGGGRRKLKGRERVRTIDGWGLTGMAKLSRANGERPLTLHAALAKCVEHGAVPIKETKSRAFATSERPWEQMKETCRRHDVPMWCKTLATMWGLKGKVALAHSVGVPLAVIYGKGLRGRARRVTRTLRISKRWTIKPYATW